MFNIVCITNNRNILEKYLERSLNDQDQKYFKRFYLDFDQNLKSLPKQFNQNLDQLTNDYTLFVHHDVEILENNFFSKLIKIIKKK